MLTKYHIWPLFLLNLTISNINLPHNHIRHIVYHEYARGTTAAQALMPCMEKTLLQNAHWYQRFRSGDNSLEGEPRSGKPSQYGLPLL